MTARDYRELQIDLERRRVARLRTILERVEALWVPAGDTERALLEEIRAELSRGANG